MTPFRLDVSNCVLVPILPVTAPNHCKIQHVLHFLNRFLALMNTKNAGILRVFPKIEDRDVNETL